MGHLYIKSETYRIIDEFDIAIIPYDINFEFNRFCYPMKLFEYFYLKKPVVSTQIEELNRFSPIVKIGKDATEWGKMISGILSTTWSKENQQKQRSFSKANSWEKKINNIIDELTLSN